MAALSFTLPFYSTRSYFLGLFVSLLSVSFLIVTFPTLYPISRASVKIKGPRRIDPTPSDYTAGLENEHYLSNCDFIDPSLLDRRRYPVPPSFEPSATVNDQAVYEPLNVNDDLAIQDDYHENVNPQPYLPYNDFPLPALDADYDFPLQKVEGLIELDPQYSPYLGPSLSNIVQFGAIPTTSSPWSSSTRTTRTPTVFPARHYSYHLLTDLPKLCTKLQTSLATEVSATIFMSLLNECWYLILAVTWNHTILSSNALYPHADSPGFDISKIWIVILKANIPRIIRSNIFVLLKAANSLWRELERVSPGRIISQGMWRIVSVRVDRYMTRKSHMYVAIEDSESDVHWYYCRYLSVTDRRYYRLVILPIYLISFFLLVVSAQRCYLFQGSFIGWGERARILLSGPSSWRYRYDEVKWYGTIWNYMALSRK